ncbi:MAG: response regulator transcription factor [Flavobacteriales bacterium]|nr:response regulator transcription factor [Flavobacteriales bacterium]
MPIRVAIVEDDPVLRASVQRIVEREGDLQWKGSYSSAEEFMARTSGLEDLDVVLMDINLPGITGIACIAECKPKREQVQSVEHHLRGQREHLQRAERRCHWLPAEERAAGTRGARHPRHPGRWFADEFAHRPETGGKRAAQEEQQRLAGKSTKREREVLDQLAGGYRYKEIADRMELEDRYGAQLHPRHLYQAPGAEPDGRLEQGVRAVARSENETISRSNDR